MVRVKGPRPQYLPLSQTREIDDDNCAVGVNERRFTHDQAANSNVNRGRIYGARVRDRAMFQTHITHEKLDWAS